MPRIRTIKPQFWTDEKIGKLTWGARLLFIGTWNLADDEGILVWDSRYLKGQLFPYDNVQGQMTRWMKELIDADLIRPYLTSCNDQLAIISHAGRHQVISKPQPSHYELPTIFPDFVPRFTKNSGNGNGTFHVDSMQEEGRRKKEEGIRKGVTNDNSATVRLEKFEKFWKVYPKKKSKGQAERAFFKINPDEQLLAVMIAKIEQAMKSEDWIKENSRFIPHPATWLNAKGWEDEINLSHSFDKTGGNGNGHNQGHSERGKIPDRNGYTPAPADPVLDARAAAYENSLIPDVGR